MSLVRRCSSPLALLLTGLLAASAAGQQLGTVDIKQAEAFRCLQLAIEPEETAGRGFLRTVRAPAGQSFIVIWLELTATTEKDEDGDDATRIPSDVMKLVDAQGASYAPVGHCTRDGRFTTYSRDLYRYNERSPRLAFSLVFVAPESGGSWTVKMGDNSARVDVPAKAEPTIDRTTVASFQVSDVRVAGKLETSLQLGRYDHPNPVRTMEVVESAAGRYLVVRVVIKPKRGNVSGSEESDFYVNSDELTVMYGAAVVLPPIGHLDGREFSAGYTSVGSERDAAGDFPARAIELVYLLPGKLTKFQLLYLGQKIAEADIPASP